MCFHARKTAEFGRAHVWRAYIPQPFTVSCSQYLGSNVNVGTSCFIAVWVLQVSRGSVLMRVLQVPGTLQVCRPLVLIVFEKCTRSTEILSIRSRILGVRSIFRPSVHRVDNSQAHCSAQTTHRWFDEWELEQSEYSQYLDVLLIFIPGRQQTYILPEYISYVVLDFTQPVSTYHVATTTSRNFLYLRLSRKH